MSTPPHVTELRLVVTVTDYEEALHFYKDVLGLRQEAVFESPGGRGCRPEYVSRPSCRRSY